MKICNVDGCENRQQARGLCNTHYWRFNQYGDANYEGPRNRASRLRREMNENGATRYATGAPCLRGHIGFRVSGGQCIECKNIAQRARYRKDPTRQRIAIMKWVQKNQEKMKAAVKRWEAQNRDRKNEQSARRRAIEKMAMPLWANRKAITAIYHEARLCGMVVDHVIPLNSKIVCGLHVENNLQLLSAFDNKKKHNKFNAAGGVV